MKKAIVQGTLLLMGLNFLAGCDQPTQSEGKPKNDPAGASYAYPPMPFDEATYNSTLITREPIFLPMRDQGAEPGTGEAPARKSAATSQAAILRNYGGNWSTVQPPPISPVSYVTGDNLYGIIICGGADGRSVRYMNSYSENIWKTLADIPADLVPVAGIAGDNHYGPIVWGGVNRDKVAYMNSYASNAWTIMPAAPFKIGGLDGDNAHGPVIYNQDNPVQLAYRPDYSKVEWRYLPNAPFATRGIAGENACGIVIYGDSRKMASLSNYSGNWTTIKPAPIDPNRITGGVFPQGIFSEPGVIVSGSAGDVYWMGDVFDNQGTWNRVVNNPLNSVGLSGDNRFGLVSAGN